MKSLWNSPEAMALATSVVRWAVAIIGIIGLVLGHRLATLQARAKEEDKKKAQAAMEETRKIAKEDSIRMQREVEMTKNWIKNMR